MMTNFKSGDIVIHKKYGKGKVLKLGVLANTVLVTFSNNNWYKVCKLKDLSKNEKMANKK
ncbi:MAG: hypothetical protein R3321_00980 [Nitrososphaeraceae archaeon]|nr:hypothetical protein [Nitrososphaeraceae archaeon]